MVRKAVISGLLFAVILTLGGIENYKLQGRRHNDIVSPGHYSIYSTNYQVDAPSRSHPFSSREYVRIVQRQEDE